MRRSVLTFVSIFLSFFIIGCGGPSNKEISADGVTQSAGYVEISKDQIQGTWVCSRYVFDNGMEQDFMKERMPKVVFSGDKVNYFMKDYDYKIKGKKIILTFEGKPVDATPFMYNGKNLVQVGDDAKIYYKKK